MSLGYGLITIGRPESHITFSNVFAGNDLVQARHFFSISAAHRIAPNKLITSENWTILQNQEILVTLSMGVRKFHPKAAFTFCIAGIIMTDSNVTFIPFPLLGASFKL